MLRNTIIGNVSVLYNRKEKGWQAENGTIIATFPAGKEGKAAAIAKAVFYQDEELHSTALKLVAKHPQLSSRAWKAAQLIINRCVWPDDGLINDGVALVVSQSDKARRYTISKREVFVCQCDDYQFEHAPILTSPRQIEQKMCKHILAVMILHHLGRFKAEVR